MIALAIVPIACFLTYQAFADVRGREARIEEALGRSAAAFAQSVDREVASSVNALTVLSHSELFQQERIKALGRLLQGKPRRDWDSVFLLDRDGASLLDTAARHAPGDAARLRELHGKVAAKGGPILSAMANSQGPALGVTLALPIEQNGRLRYVLGARMTDGVWQRLAAGATTPEGGTAALFDEHNRLLGASANGVEGEDVFAAWQTLPMAGWRVRVSVPSAPIVAAHRKAIVSALSASGACLAVGVLLAALLGRRVNRRFAAPQRPAAEPPADIR